jgi:hypothetical protein
MSLNRYTALEIRQNKKLLVKDQGKKNEAVFDPLARAHGFDKSFEHADILL